MSENPNPQQPLVSGMQPVSGSIPQPAVSPSPQWESFNAGTSVTQSTTSPAPVKSGEDGEQTAGDSAAPKLADNEVLLTDGRVVEVMETSPRHDESVERLLGQCGLSLVGLGSVGYTRAMALCSLYSVGRLDTATGEVVDRQPVPVPRTKLMWEERKDFIGTTKDTMRIVAKYQDVNGLDTGDNFR
jgi:hypothetical protein